MLDTWGAQTSKDEMSKYSKEELFQLVKELYDSGEEWRQDGSPEEVTVILWNEIHGI